MKATFIAWGPAIKRELNIPEFQNAAIYPILARTQGFSYGHKINGCTDV